jgi:competence protein ComEC
MKLNLSALLFAGGTFVVWFLPWLIPLKVIFLTLALALVILKYLNSYPAFLFLLGLSWGIYHANQVNETQLVSAKEGIDAQIIGTISSIPQHRGLSQRFVLRVESFQKIPEEEVEPWPNKLLLSWYQVDDLLKVGDKYRFDVRLRRPRGLSNFNQFDYRRWLLGQGIDATGYVRGAERIGASEHWLDRINLMRFERRSDIAKHGFASEALLLALGLGIKDDIGADQWQLFLQTGVIHLMVISGLHIGFAALVGFWLFGLIAKPVLALGFLHTDLTMRWSGGLAFAIFYAALAGLSLPTTRALIMLSLLAITRVLKINWSGWTFVSIALAFIALLQPAAVLQDSFWLSFGAVLVLICALGGRAKQSFLLSLIRAQWMLLVGFGGVLIFLQKPLYLGGFFSNLLAVPLTGFILVPLILIAVLLLPFAAGLSALLLRIADVLLIKLLDFLYLVSQLPLPKFDPIFDDWLPAVLLCLAGLLFVGFPSGRIRIVLVFSLLPLLLGVRHDKGDFSILLFDVGQGTAVLIEQPGYRLLYDLGPAYSQQFNAGAHILLPHLQKGTNRLDSLIVSHDDTDHSGGLEPILEAMEIGELFAGGPKALERGLELDANHCQAGQAWTIEQVSYSFLHPRELSQFSSSNNQSCVLLIEFGSQRILLAGDIESNIEAGLMRFYPELRDIDWLLIPHHGSRTSSSESFVKALSPSIAAVSAGYGNSFGHPTVEVIDRYQAVGAEIFSTAESGALQFSWDLSDSVPEIKVSRDQHIFWWQE